MKLWGLLYHKLLTDNDNEEENVMVEARMKEARSLQKKAMNLNRKANNPEKESSKGKGKYML